MKLLVTFHLDEDEHAFYASACNSEGRIGSLGVLKDAHYQDKNAFNREVREMVNDGMPEFVAKILRDMLWNVTR